MAMSQKEQDIQMMLAAQCHLGTKNCNYRMERYCYKRRDDGIWLINLEKTYEKMQMAARAIVAVENPQDVYLQSARPYAQRAVFKFAQYTQSKSMAGRFTPGTFTNQIQKAFEEPRLLLVTDPLTDHQPIKEASYGNIPTIAFCDTDASLEYVDIAIPVNNKARMAIGVVYFLLARMVLTMRGTLTPDTPWDAMVDLFFYREPEEPEAEAEEETYGGGGGYTGGDTGGGGFQSMDNFGLPAPVGAEADNWGAAPAPAAPTTEVAAVEGGWAAAEAPTPDPAGGWGANDPVGYNMPGHAGFQTPNDFGGGWGS